MRLIRGISSKVKDKLVIRTCRVVVLVSTLFISPTLFALPDDTQQPIRIKADSAERNEKTGQTIYDGNVIIEQGSLQITADQVVIEGGAGNITSIRATGRPAHLEQQPRHEQSKIHARGYTIYYHLEQKLVELKGKASLVQQGSTVSGERIDYFIADQIVKAHSDSDSTTESTRVEVVIPAPQANNGTGTKPKPVPPTPPISSIEETPDANP